MSEELKPLTRETARVLCEAFGIDDKLDDQEEVYMLRENNQALLDAMIEIHRLAHSPAQPTVEPISSKLTATHINWRCAGCGQNVEPDHGALGHTRTEHSPKCDGDRGICAPDCPVPIACGPVEPFIETVYGVEPPSGGESNE